MDDQAINAFIDELVNAGYSDDLGMQAALDDALRRATIEEGEAEDYYEVLLLQTQGDYDRSIEILTQDYQNAVGENNEKFLVKINDAAKVLDNRAGRIGADYETARSDNERDRKIFQESIREDRRRLSEDFVRAKSELELQQGELLRESDTGRNQLEESQLQRGVYSGGVVEEEQQGMEDRINALQQRLDARRQQTDASYNRAERDIADRKKSFELSSDRQARNLNTGERRAREDALQAFGRSKQGLGIQYGNTDVPSGLKYRAGSLLEGVSDQRSSAPLQARNTALNELFYDNVYDPAKQKLNERTNK